MRVPTANVMVGFDREVMDRLFTDGATYKSLIQGLTNNGDLDNVLLFDNESNPNFVSFEHSFLGGKMQMKLTFIDPKGEFERRFLTDNVPRNIAGFNSNTEVYNKFTYEKQAPSQEDVISKKASEETKQSQKLYDNKFFADLQKDLSGYYGERFFYVAYGSGNNLDLWSGPHRTVLMNAEVTLKGARKITITLVPTENPVLLSHRRGAYNEEVNLNLAGLTMRYSGISKPIEFSNLLKEGGVAYDPLTHLGLEKLAVSGITGEIATVYKNRTDITDALKKIGLDEASSELGEFDFHSIIVDALRSYVQKATANPNVIILLPNINVTCRQWINESLVNTRNSWNLKKEKTVKELENLQAGLVTSSVGEQDISVRTGKMNLFGTFVTEAVKSHYASETLLQELGYKENFMSNFLSSFGLGLHQVLKDYANNSGYLKAIPSHTISALQHYEKATSAGDRWREYYDVHNFYAIVQKASNKGIPNHVDVLKTVIAKINENAKEDYQIDWAVYNETDIKLLDFWGGSIKTLPTHKFPTFGGYRDFNTQKEAVIFGDKALIQQYLYGKEDLDAKFANIQEYEDFASLAKENQNKYESDSAAALAGNDPNPINPWATSKPYSQSSSDLEAAESYSAKADAEAKNYNEGIIGAVKAIPLHPLDAIILTNKSYNKAVREIAFPVTTGVGSFGDISDVPDTFGYSDQAFTKDKLDYMKKQGIPIFRYNTKNPNVLDITFKFAGIYFAALKAGFVTAVKRKASAVAEGVLPIGNGSLPIRTRGAAIQYLRQKNFSLNKSEKDRAEIIAGLKANISIELMESMQADNPAHAADAIAALLETKIQSKDDADLKGLIEIDQGLPGNPQSIMTDLTENMYRNALGINIKTLPLFHVSKVHYLSSPCVVFAQDAPIKQSVDANRTLMNSFFSGLYLIMGFKHTINTSKATSEFSLVKNQADFSPETKELQK